MQIFIPFIPIFGTLFLEFDSKIKLGDQLIYVLTNHSNWGIYNFSCVLKILASQNRIKSLYHEIFNINRFLD